MATTKETSTSDIRDEFNALKEEVGHFINILKDYEKERINSVRENLSDEVSEYRNVAKEKMRQAQATGEQTLNDVEGKIRDNPLSSLVIAFAVGFLASKITRKGS